MSKQYTVKVIGTDNSEQITVFQAGQAARIKALPKAQYQLIEAISGSAPEVIQAKRVGNDLHIGEIDGQEQSVVIEGYFDSADSGTLVGQAQDGLLYSYSVQESAAQGAAAERDIAYVLGHNVVNAGAALGTLAFQPLMAAASLSGAVAVVSGGSNNTAAIASATAAAPTEAAPKEIARIVENTGSASVASAEAASAATPAANTVNSLLGPVSHGTAVKDVAIASEGPILGRSVSVASDTTAPTSATAAIRPQSDSGSSNTDGITNNKRPLIAGQTEASAKVELTVGGKTYTTQANSSGRFEVQVDQDLSDGVQTISMKVSDESDNSATFSGTSFTVDTAGPAAPSDVLINDNAGASKGDLKSGDRTDDSTPTMSGKAPAGTEFVRVYSNGALVTTVAVDQDKLTWSFVPTTSLVPGAYSWQVASVDKAGNEGAKSDAIAFTVVTEAARTAAITGVFDNQGALQGLVGKSAATDDRVLEVRGSGVAGDTVRLLSNNTQVGQATVDSNGQWAVTTSQLSLGNNDLVARLFNGTSQRGADSGAYRVVVDTAAPKKPSFTVSDDMGTDVGQLVAGDTTDDVTPVLAGTGATAGDTIVARDGNSIIGTAIVDSKGNWTLTPANALSDGDRTLSVTARNAAGVESEAQTFAFKLSADALNLSVLRAVDNVAGKMGAIPHNGLTNDTTPTLEGTGRPGLRVIITEDGKSIGNTVIDADGNWRFTVPSSAGTEGTHTFTANTLSAVGGSQSSSFTITIDTTAPAAPSAFDVRDDVGSLQAALTSGAATDDNTPTFEGKGATPGEIITVYEGNTVVGSAQVRTDGNWSVTVNSLAQGQHTLNLTQTDAAGNESARSDAFVVNVDTTAAATPTSVVINDTAGQVTGEIKDKDRTDDTTPTISGKAEAGTVFVNVYDGNAVVGTATVQQDGSWSFTPAVALTSKDYAWSVSAVDSARNESDRSPVTNFTVVTDAPNAPAITNVVDNQGTITGNVAKDSTTDDRQLEVRGTGTAGNKIELFADGKKVGETTVQNNGSWSITTSQLAEGEVDLTAKQVDTIGQTSPETGAYSVVVDITAPGTPAFDVKDNVGGFKGDIKSGDTTDDATPTFEGKGATPGDTITVREGNTVLGTATVDEDGNWSVTPTNALSEGAHKVSVVASDPAGNPSTAGEISFTVDTTDQPVSITRAVDDVDPTKGNVAPGGVTNDQSPTLQGTGKPGVTVTISKDGKTVDSVVVDANGNWTFDIEDELDDGEHTYTANAVNAAGNPSSDSFKFTVDTQAPDAPKDFEVKDDVGAKQGKLTDGDSTDDVTPTIEGKGATPGDVIKVYADGKVVGSELVKADGTWSVTTESLPQGEQELTVTQTDKAGNESKPSEPFTVVVDTRAPNAPTVDTVTNKLDADDKPTSTEVKGKAEPGSTVTVLDEDGKVVGTTTTDANGDFTVVVTPALENGETYDVIASDKAGNPSAPTEITADTSAPDSNTTQISVNDITADNIVNAAESGTTIAVTGKVTGQFRAGDVVSVTANGVTTTGAVASNGNYSVNVSGNNLAKDSDTKIRVSVRATDASNNAGNIGIDKTYSVDTAAPDSNTTQISVNSITADNIVNAAESGTTIAVTGKVTGQFRNGDVVRVTANGVTTSGTVDSKGDYSVNVSGNDLAKDDDRKIQVSVRATDAVNNAGNISTEKTYTVDTVAPNSGSTTIAVSSITADNILNASEVNGTVAVAGTVSGEFKQGDVIKVTANGVTTSATVAADGKFSVDVSGANLNSDSDTKVQVSLTTTDTAGNTGTIVVDKTYTVDTTAPTLSISLSDTNLVPGQTSQVTFSFSERVSGFDANDIIAPNGSISNLATADSGRTWTATFTPTAGVNDNTNTISVGNGYTDIGGNGGSGATSANYAILTTVGASLGNATTVSRTVTTYNTVNTYSTAYRTILDDTRVSGDSVGHDWRIRYKLSNGQQGEIDINDSRGWTDGRDWVVYQGSHVVGVTDLMVYQPGKKDGLWLSQKNGGFNYTNVSNIGLEDCHGIFGWGWFADWNDAYLNVRVESYQQHTGSTQQASTTTVRDTQYNVNFDNAALYASETPNACYRIVLTGGSNYQLRDASGKVLMTGAGTYQATISQIEAGLKVYVLNGGSAPSVSTSLVSTTSPIVLDLNGDGVQTTTVDDGVQFDLDASGAAQQVAWIDSNDGLLVLDLNGNGTIDNGSEMFGNHTQLANGSKAADGWQALEQYDSNGDRVISALDDIFSQLQVWVDANGDGVTGEGELFSLQDLGIKDIALDHDGSQTVQNGNLLSGMAHATTDNGQQLQVTDAWLETKPLEEQQPQVASYIVI